MADVTGDLVSLSREQEALRQTVGVYDGFAKQPGLAVALARSGATGAQIAATGGFLRGLDLTRQVTLARASGVNIDLTDDDRAALSAYGTSYQDVDRIAKEAQAAAAQQPQGDGGLLGKLSRFANRVTTLPVIKQGFQGLDRAADMANTVYRAGTEYVPGFSVPGDIMDLTGRSDHAGDRAEMAQGMAAGGYDPGNPLSTLAFLSRGKQVFRNMDDLRAEYGTDQVSLAQQYLIDPQSFMDPKLPTDELIRRDKALQDPTFKALTEHVDAKRSSPGRDIAGALGINPDSKPYTVISGSTDAVWAFAADPTIAVGAAAKGARILRYGINGTSDSARIRALMEGNAAVRRGWSLLLDDAKVMRSGTREEAAAAYARVQARTPELLPMLDEINGGGYRSGLNSTKPLGPIDTYEDLVDHVEGTVALTRMRNGLAASEARLMPGAVSAYGARRLKGWAAGTRTTNELKKIDLVKEAAQIVGDDADAIGMAGEDLTGLSGKVGDAALAYRRTLRGKLDATRRKWQLLPERQSIKLDSADGAETVRRFAALYMPNSHANALAARYATATVGERRTIAQAVEDQVIHAAGIPSTVSGQAWLEARRAKRVVDDNSIYDHSGKNNDRIAGEGEGQSIRRAALYSTQTNSTYVLPNFRELRQVAAKVTIYERTLGRAFEADAVDRVLSHARLGWITTPSGALRNSLEAVGSAATRDLKGREVARSRAALTATGTDTAGGRLRSGMRNAVRHVAGKVADDELEARARELEGMAATGELDDFLALTGRSGAMRGAGDELADPLGRGYRVREAAFKSDGYELGSADGANGARNWHRELRLRAASPEGKLVAQALDRTPASRKALVDFLLSKSFKEQRASMERFSTLRDGTLVGDDPNLLRRAAEELADDQIADMRALVSDADGNVIPKVAKAMKSGYAPDFGTLSGLSRPASVIQPKYIVDLSGNGDLKSNLAQALGDRAYDLVVGKPMAWLASMPILHANYVKAYRDVEKAFRENPALGADLKLRPPNHALGRSEDVITDDSAIAQKIQDMAYQHAFDLTVQMIDNPRVRSQFSLVTRNMFNFWRAQEDFLRRWGRNLKESPEDIRKAQLIVEGGMHTGIVTQNEDGELILNYPGSGWGIKTLGNALSHFGLGESVKVPVLPNLSTKLTFLNAGLDRPILPTVSPMAAVPIRVFKHFSGDLIDPVKAVQLQSIAEGDISPSRGWWQQFTPSIVNRFLVSMDQDEREGQYASATRNAILNAYASGELPADATPSQVQEFKDRIRTGVRNHLAMRAVFGLVLPGAPSTPSEESDASRTNDLERGAWNALSFKDEFRAMSNKLGYDKALQVWSTNRPHDLIYTVSTTETAGNASTLSPTDTVLRWMSDNPELVKKYPQLAAYFAPNGPGDFSSEAWKAELELGLRQHKNLDTFTRDVAVKNAESMYYKMRNQRDGLVAEALGRGDSNEADRLKSSFSAWSTEFQNANPLLREKFAAGQQRAATAAGLLNEITDLVNSPTIKSVDPDGSLKLLLDAYTAKQQWEAQHTGRTKQEQAQKDGVDASYQEYVANVLGKSKYLIPLWQGVFDKVD